VQVLRSDRDGDFKLLDRIGREVDGYVKYYDLLSWIPKVLAKTVTAFTFCKK
jgi:hypothetical protein